MSYYKKMCGKNVYLSPMTPEDAETILNWFASKELTDKLGSSELTFTVEQEKEWITNNSSRNWSIILNDGDKIIGSCGFNNIDKTHQTAIVGLFIGSKEMRGKGYGTEALKLLLDFAFNTLNIYNVELHVFDFNTVAIKSYLKCGFKEIGRRRQAYFCNGQRHDIVYMDILRDEFNAYNKE